MAEYIEREALLEALKEFRLNETMSKHLTREDCETARNAIERAQMVIECIPAADVAPVRHGKWVHSRYENCSEQFEMVKCSCCGREAYAMAFYVRDGNYCPNCGAKMDGSADYDTDGDV